MSDRRTFLRGAGALAALTLTGGVAAAVPAFDPVSFVGELRAIGLEPYAFRHVEGGVLQPWRWGIYAPPDTGFGDAFSALAARWRPAMKANPDHGDRVAAYIAMASQA